MGRARTHKGEVTQRRRPDWSPLLCAVGERITGDFMWMFKVELTYGTPLQPYTHIDSRRYVHLDPSGAAFAYEEFGRYRRVPLANVLAEVFAPLPGLAGVTPEQIGASWAALARASSEAVDPAGRSHVDHMRYSATHGEDDPGSQRPG